MPKNLTSFERLFLPTVPAVPIRPSVAFACLKSIKLNRKTALEQLEFLRPLLEWHSTLDYLRNPPRGYLSEGVDILRGIDDIAAKVKRGRNGYANEFEFLADVYTLISIRIRDGHVGYPPVLMDLFTFCMGVQFISISKDGLSLPKIYVYGTSPHKNQEPQTFMLTPIQTTCIMPTVGILRLRWRPLTVYQHLTSCRNCRSALVGLTTRTPASTYCSQAPPSMQIHS